MIEEAIQKLTAAVERNNELLERVLASAGSDAPVTEEPKPAPAKKKAVVEVKTKAEPVEEVKEPEPATEEPEAEEPKFTIVQAIEASKKFLAADRDANKPKLEALREKFGITTVKDLAPNQIDAYMAELAKL